MKKIEISVPKVHCIKKNDFLVKDKVYLVCLVTSVEVDSETKPKIIFAGISNITKFRKNNAKKLPLGSNWNFEVTENEVFNISFGLYEYDKGDTYEQYQNKIDEIISTDGLSLDDVVTFLWDEIKDQIASLNISKLLLALPKVGIKVLQELRKDDLLGKRSISYKYNDSKLDFNPEFNLTDSNSHYNIQLNFKKMN